MAQGFQPMASILFAGSGGDKRDRTADLLNAIRYGYVLPAPTLSHRIPRKPLYFQGFSHARPKNADTAANPRNTAFWEKR